MKEYKKAEIEIIGIDEKDIITTSGEPELPEVPFGTDN